MNSSGLLEICNLYAYCDNNPILKADEEGQIAGWLVSAALGAAVNVVASFIIAQTMGQDFVAGNVAATGSIDLVVNTGYTGMASAVSAAASANHKKGNTASSKSTHSKKGSYMNSMKPRKISDRIVRKGRHVYRVKKYLYLGRIYIKWDILK